MRTEGAKARPDDLAQMTHVFLAKQIDVERSRMMGVRVSLDGSYQ
ncbi:hypothetical protein [Stenomitos frigidus]|nr:hypothetical protein [Stenomitos frigidus]